MFFGVRFSRLSDYCRSSGRLSESIPLLQTRVVAPISQPIHRIQYWLVVERPKSVSGKTTKQPFQEVDVMAEGTIKKKTDKGFGFIDIGGGEDIFFHSANCEVSYDDLQEGQRVSFTEGQGPKGPRAENVSVV